MTQSKWSLTGKKVLITGGTKGIGLAVANEVLSLGGAVFVVARDKVLLQKLIEKWRQNGYQADGRAMDITDAEERILLVKEYADKYDKLDVLVNNVGTNIRKKSVEYQMAEFDTIMNTNMKSNFHLSNLCYPLLQKSGSGVVVNVLSVAGLIHLRSGAPYGMTKAALSQLTRNLAVEWAKDGIRVNAVAPWYTKTPLVETLLADQDYYTDIINHTPLGRIAEAEEVAAVISFLSMPAASYITGQTIAVDGGFLIDGF